eukprot:1281722-Prymnesium_polylepis.1
MQWVCLNASSYSMSFAADGASQRMSSARLGATLGDGSVWHNPLLDRNSKKLHHPDPITRHRHEPTVCLRYRLEGKEAARTVFQPFKNNR